MGALRTAVALAVPLLAAELLYKLYERWTRGAEPLKGRRREVHEVIMFSQKSGREAPGRLLAALGGARESLDACMYLVTSVEVGGVLAALVARGVRVRLLVDADMAYASGSQVRRLVRSGALVRSCRSTALMHHKFCLLDADSAATPQLVTGSLNWTNQAFAGNWENVLITSQETLVREYREEFERLWSEFKAEPPPMS